MVVDDCQATLQDLDEDPVQGIEVLSVPRDQFEVGGVARVGALRARALATARGRWIAFLDDDNEWDPNHLASLLDVAECTGHRAVHSHRTLVWPCGCPYVDPRVPWAADDEVGRSDFVEWVRQGIAAPGSPVLRDQAGQADDAAVLRTVDMGEWLLDRSLLNDVGIAERFTPAELANGTGEDDKLLDQLLDRGEPISCTHKPTLRYQVGGFSNNVRSSRNNSSTGW